MAEQLLESMLQAPPTGGPAWLAHARERARDALLRDGLPLRDEAWKYTSLRALAQRRFATNDPAGAYAAVDPQAFAMPGLEGARLVLVDGVFRADLSRLPTEAGVEVRSLGDALASVDGLLRGAFEDEPDDPGLAFVRLNTVLARDGLVLRVAAGARVDLPVHLVAFATGGAARAWHARILVELGDGATLTLVEHHAGAADDAQLGNLVCRHRLGSGARLDVLQVQDAPESSIRIRRSAFALAADAQLNLRTLELGAALARHDIAVELGGECARFASRGVFVGRGRQHQDTHLGVRHAARDTACDLVWRGVAGDRARGVLHGAITVEAGADGTDASLDTKNLLLSSQAEIDAQPVLEILADEGKAAHGATVGQLDAQALFYLRSRGIPEAHARALLTLAFCRIAIDSLTNVALREHVDRMLLRHLPAEIA